MIIIRSKKEGFRRCGVAHPATATEYPAGTVTPGQIEALHNEPMLMVLEIHETQAELTNKPVPAADMIALVKAAGKEDLAKLAEGETRKTVLEAIVARSKELEA